MTICALLAACSLLTVMCGCRRAEEEDESRLAEVLPVGNATLADDPADVWESAVAPRNFEFPRDHGAHPDYRIEWWYYTGNLETREGRKFGYQLTFFRTGINRDPANPSRWAVRDLYTAHFALSDLANKRHSCFQRNSRGGVGQAGAATDRLQVWNGEWKAWMEGDDHRLQAGDGEMEIDLSMTPAKPLVLHGEGGLSQKGAEIGNASYYYSFTRLSTEGTVTIDGETLRVSGSSWMDHEFSTSFLEKGQLGWDWFSIQLDNGQELMVYRMRREDGTADAYSSGSLISADGNITHLDSADFILTPRRSWTSEQTGGEYPLAWTIEIPSHGYRLEVTPAFDAQEMTTEATTGISYWEGAINIDGSTGQGRITGQGYMELTGYVGQGLGSLFE